jgi:phosphoglycolate phosphatase
MSMQGSEHPKFKTVIFDLDGTLIDSAPSILAGLNMVMKKSKLLPAIPLDSCLVGPPLKEILLKLVGDQANVDIDILVSNFKEYYDSEGFKASIPYPGVDELLNQLTCNASLYLATNKRLEPTLKIIDYFGWASLFDNVYAIDKFKDTPFSNKASMIHVLIQAESIKKEHAIYIGDRIEDFEASKINGIDTILVTWGYGQFKDKTSINGFQCADSPKELYEMIMGTL